MLPAALDPPLQMIQKHGLNLQLVGDLKGCNLCTDQQFKDITIRDHHHHFKV